MSKNKRFIALLCGAAVFLICSFFGYSRFSNVARQSIAAAAAVDRPTTAISTAPPDSTLAAEINRAINESNLTQARWGVFVMSLKDGRVLCSQNGSELFMPASNMKVYTTAVALDLLGADYRWRTSVYAEKQPDLNGIVEGDLVLYGRGAPDLISDQKGGAPSLPELADQIYQHGVREVRGNVVGDSSYFRGELYGLGWQWNDLQWYYGAEPSALTVDANAANLIIAPGKRVGESATVRFERASDLHITNNTTTGERLTMTTIGISRGMSDNDVRVWGEFPIGGRSFGAFLSVDNPTLWAAALLKEALVARGIKVDGESRSRDSRVADSDKFDPTKAVELAAVTSETLGEAVRETNKQSNNLYAELILRTLGKEKVGSSPPEDSNKRPRRGDDEVAVALINSWLKSHDIDADKLAIRDGSGLSRLDLVTPESTARLLAAIAKTNSASAFRDSLPIAGRDGTLKGRLSNVADRIFAKTGTVVYVHTLSGYAMRNNEVLAFAIFCNDAVGRANPVRLIDEIAGLIAGNEVTPRKK